MSKTTLREILAQFRQHLVNGVMSDTPQSMTLEQAEAAINECISENYIPKADAELIRLRGYEAAVIQMNKNWKARLSEIIGKDETDPRWDGQWRNGYNSAKAEIRKRAGINPTEGTNNV